MSRSKKKARKRTSPKTNSELYDKIDIDLPPEFELYVKNKKVRYGINRRRYELYRRSGAFIVSWQSKPAMKSLRRYLIINGKDQGEFSNWAVRNGLPDCDTRHERDRSFTRISVNRNEAEPRFRWASPRWRSHSDGTPLKSLPQKKIEKLIVMFERELRGRTSGEF